MSRLEAACIEQYRLNAQAFDAMADRLILEAEMTLALHARKEAARHEGLAKLIESMGLDKAA